jgi:hypothetical protein
MSFDMEEAFEEALSRVTEKNLIIQTKISNNRINTLSNVNTIM